MKRIITAGTMGLAVTVFFTGCSSLVGSMEVDYKEIQTSAAAEVVTDENGENRLGITEGEKEAPDYFRKNMEEKFKNLEGKEAFQIKAGHSKEQDDMEGFQIAALRSDKTFIYGYVTRVKNGESSGKMVHCGAFYNYDSGVFQAFHENIYGRDWESEGEEAGDEEREGEESFFIQVCEPEGDIFVYDNGHGYIYDDRGSLKFHGDIEGFIRKQFRDVHEVSVINAVTDGQNRIYLEVSIEKEAVEVPGWKSEDLELTQDISVDDEGDELDEDLEQKVESRILVYEYKRVNSGMDQENEAFEAQKSAWIARTRDQEYEEAPDGLADWNQAVENYPDQWGDAWLGDLEDVKVYQWKGEAAFASEEGITSFLPEADSYVNFREVKEQWELEKLFIPWGGKYNDLLGKTGDFVYYDPQAMERQYTLVWYEESEEGGEEGESELIKHTEVHTQTLSGVETKRYVPLNNAYVESYWVMDKKKAVSLGKCIEGDIQCVGEDEKVRWIQPGGTLLETSYQVTEDTQAGTFVENGTVYFVEFGRDFMSVVRDEAHGGSQNEQPQKIRYEKLAGGYEPGGSIYDAVLEKRYEEDLPEVESVYGVDYYTEDQVLPASLSLDSAAAGELAARGDNGICTLAAAGGTQGFLLTSQDKGLIFYDPRTEKSAVLEGGSWFGTWKLGSEYVSVGFLGENLAYGGMDAVFSRVYEYDLSMLCNESMKESLREMKEKEAEEARLQAEETGRQPEESGGQAEEDEEEDETEKNPLDRWNEEYKEKHTQGYPKE